MPKRPLDINVYEAAVERTRWTFETFDKVYVAFSGGKDSTVMLHIAADEARRVGKRFALVFIDLEGQYRLTIEHTGTLFDEYADVADPYWIALPIHLRNAVSMYEPFWMCWDPEACDAWIRTPPDYAITDPDVYPWFYPGMEFEDFVPRFGAWYGQGESVAALVGIRTDESLNRFRTIASTSKETVGGHQWTTVLQSVSTSPQQVVNVYPIYDWRTEDIWTYHARNPNKRYNELYDLMYRAGLSIHQMRICQPYGDDQRRGLWLYQLIEPETWGRVVARVNGANQGAMYATESGNINGYRRVSKPAGHTWQSFARLLLASMPDRTREHYENKIVLFMKWHQERGYPNGIPDEAPYELETARKVPSWRRVCKSLLRNDWWAKGLGFTQHKSHAYGQYLDLMRRRRAASEYQSAVELVSMEQARLPI